MVICFRIGGIAHCFFIPVIPWPYIPQLPGPGPVNYPELFQDGIVVNSMQAVLANVADEEVRGALQSGINAAVGALARRAGEHVTVRPVEQ